MAICFVYGYDHNSLRESRKFYRVVCLKHSRVSLRPVFTHVHGHAYHPCTQPCLRLMYTGRLRPVYTALYMAVFTAPVCTAMFTADVYGRVYGLCIRPSTRAVAVCGPPCTRHRLCLRPWTPRVSTVVCVCAGRLQCRVRAVYTRVHNRVH